MDSNRRVYENLINFNHSQLQQPFPRCKHDYTLFHSHRLARRLERDFRTIITMYSRLMTGYKVKIEIFMLIRLRCAVLIISLVKSGCALCVVVCGVRWICLLILLVGCCKHGFAEPQAVPDEE